MVIMMIHTFDSEIAEKYGVNCAILLQFIFFWCEKNKANGKHFYDGHYWTYNSRKALQSLFPYLSERQIRTGLEKLTENSLIIKGNYNKKGFDKTNWYALTELGYSIVQKSPIEWVKKSNALDTDVQPIPVNIQLLNKKINKKDFENEFEDFWNRYPNKFNKPQTYKNFVKTAKSYGAKTVLRALNNYLEEIKQKNTAKEYITRSTNFVGQKAVFLGYLESETKTEKFHNLDSDDLIKKLKQEGGFE